MGVRILELYPPHRTEHVSKGRVSVEVRETVRPGVNNPLEAFENATEWGVSMYDDPYKVLATQIIASLGLGELHRFMVNDEFVRQVITHDIQSVDITSPFVACAQDILLRTNQKVKYKHALADFANFIYKELDIKRLRGYIQSFMADCGIDILGIGA